MKSFLKQSLLRFLPGPANALQVWWQRRHVRRMLRRAGVPRLVRAVTARHGRRVLSGPFVGMR